jgi:hypothetical protein
MKTKTKNKKQKNKKRIWQNKKVWGYENKRKQ